MRAQCSIALLACLVLLLTPTVHALETEAEAAPDLRPQKLDELFRLYAEAGPSRATSKLNE
jgi:hypothetical protein